MCEYSYGYSLNTTKHFDPFSFPQDTSALFMNQLYLQNFHGGALNTV